MPTREKAKTFHGRCSSESSPLTGRLERRRGCHRQIHDLRDNEGGTPSLDGRPARAVDAVRVAWERFPSPAGRVPASVGWSTRRALAFSYCFCFPCPPRLKSVCTLIWRGFISAF